MADICVDGCHWLWLEKCSPLYFTADGSICTHTWKGANVYSVICAIFTEFWIKVTDKILKKLI